MSLQESAWVEGVRCKWLPVPADYLPVWQAMRDFTEARAADTPDEIWLNISRCIRWARPVSRNTCSTAGKSLWCIAIAVGRLLIMGLVRSWLTA